MPLKHSHLIYDWNSVDNAAFKPAGRVLMNDESLRDGLQSPSVRDPSIAEKIAILHLMETLGIRCSIAIFSAIEEIGRAHV